MDNERAQATYAADETVGAAAVLILLEGLHAELTGALVHWHEGLGDRLAGVLGPSVAGPGGWETLARVQSKAREVLVALAARARDGSFGPSELIRRLALVEDAFAGALRRIDVPNETSVHCAADLTAAVGALFGLVRSAHQAFDPPARPQPTEPGPATDVVTTEHWAWAAGMP